MLPIGFGTPDVHAPSSNTAAVVTYAADGSGRSHVLLGVAWSYDATPTSGNLKIQDGVNTVFTADVSAAGPGFFPMFRQGSKNTSLTITLAAGGSGVTGKVSILGHYSTTLNADDALMQYGSNGVLDFTTASQSQFDDFE